MFVLDGPNVNLVISLDPARLDIPAWRSYTAACREGIVDEMPEMSG